MGLSIWHWVAGIGVLALLCGVKKEARGGIIILLLTFFVGRLLYLAVTR